MKKFTLLLLFLFISISGYSQLALEGFENTTGPDAIPSTNWTLGTGNWAVFDNIGSTVRWGINSTSATPPIVYNGVNAAYVNRENIGAGVTSEEYLSTPPVLIPTNGVLHFYTRMFTSGNQGTIYQIKISPVGGSQTDPNTYSLVQQWTEDELIVPTSNFNLYTEKTIDLSAFAGLAVYVAFVKVFTQPDGNLGGDRWLVDDVSIDAACLTPTALTVAGITSNSASLNWTNPNGAGATTWEVIVTPSVGTPITYPAYSGILPFIATGLSPNTTYSFQVRAVCTTGISSPWSTASANFTTSVAPPVCGGNFVDSGGVGANYANNANVTTTICPTTTGELVTVTFTAFNTENGVDLLRVYDGTDATAPLLATLSGTALPPAYTASSTSGCLTFVFTSNATTTAAGWASNVSCAPPPTCRKPTAIVSSAITSNSVTLTWTQPANPDTSVASAWQVLALPCGSLPPTAGSTGFISAPTNPFTLTGLTSATCYDIYIRAVCSLTDSSTWSGPTTVTTQLSPPVCGGNFVDTGGLAANYPNNANQTTTICPVTPGDVVTATFTSFNIQANTDFLKIYDGNDATAPLLANLSGTALPPSFTSSAATGCLTFVFTSNATTSAAGWVSNITCGAPPVCRNPTTLTTNSVLSTSVVLNWIQPANPDTTVATSWHVLALPCASPAPTAASTGFVTASTNPFTLTGLSPTTCYDIYIRAACSGVDFSTWTGPATITTQIAPPVCGGTFVDPGGTGNYANSLDSTVTICPINAGDVVTVTFTAFDTEATWDGLYVFNGNSITAPQIASANGAGNVPGGLAGSYWGTTIPGPFTSTSATGCLTFRFRTDTSGTRAGWVANVTCALPPTCIAPTAITTNTVTANSVILNWTQPVNPDTTTATAWQVLALPCASPPPTAASTGFVGASTNPYTLTGLSSATCYNIYIRAVCSPTDSSTWGGPTTITTQVAPPICGGNFVDAGGPTANYPNTSDSTVTICPITAGDVVTVTFTSFNTEANWDGLYVFDGNSIAAPQIASTNPPANVPGGLAGSFWGATIPGPFTSTSADGCLTFRFRSDASVNNPGWVSNVTCAPPPTCRTPAAITTNTITVSSVILNWTQPVNPDTTIASAWQVLALPCGSPAPNAGSTGFVNASTNPFTLTGLSSATCYDIYIRAVCSVTDSSTWGGPTTSTTQVAPPICGGNFVDAGGPTTNYPNGSDSTVTICPVNAGDVVTVTFTSFNTEANWDGLYVFDGNSITSPQIASTNPGGNVPGGLAGSFWGATIPGPFTSTSADGCLTFRFRSNASVNNPGWVSNVTCAPPPTCRTPAAITSNTLTHNSVILNWTQPVNPDTTVASAWQVLALPCGSPAPSAASTGFVNVSTNPFTLTGLTPATCYDIYIRAVCSTTDSSTWGGPRTVTTLVAPPVCGGTFTDEGGPTANYNNSSNVTTIICPTTPGEIVTVTFTAFNTEANWDGLYVYDGNTVSPATQIATANPPANVPGGIPGSYWGTTIPGPFTSTSPEGCLTFVFRSDGSVNNPGWVANVTCSPAPTCARPTLLSATNITQTSAVLNWTQLPNPDGSTATAWEILVLPAGSPVPTGNGIPATSPYTANGLSAGTAYVFYVRAICSPTDASEWSAFNFAALPVNDECANATFAIVNQNLNCVQTTQGTLSGATSSLPATTCGGAGAANDDVWFTFTATSVTHIISFNNVTPATALSYAIYQGSCGGLTQVGCNSGAGLVAGTTYYIRVFSTSTVPVFTNFNLCIGTLPCTEAPAFCTGQTVTYANSTNVPSLGQIGCLFTSPNPAFFFLQVNQAGPLSYLISQVDTGGTPRDVDYVAWGPFTDLSTACSGVPANPLGQTVPIPTPATGCPGTLHACSYSAAPQEIMCIPNAQLCEVYVIMITNFSNQAGTVTFTQTNPVGGGTTACFPINTFNYSSTYYCQNAANPTPVLAPGASAGVYTSTPGLVIDSATGTIDLLASTPGPYVVTSTSATTIGGTCNTIPFITTSRTVIITAPASATISYPAATYCNSITSSQSVVRTGTAGGTYSSTPAGLLLNQNTGEIIPVASTAGVYTVTYTIPATGGCVAYTTQTQVEILASPIVLQPSVTECDTFTLPALAVGNYYAAAGGVGTPLDISIPLISSQPVYIYAVGTNGCITEKSFNVTINTVPAPTYTVTQSTCTTPTGSIIVTSPASVGGSPASDLFISEVTDANTFSLTYVELYNATGTPVNLANYKLKFYTWGSPPTTENLSCNLQLAGTIANNTTNVIKVSNDANIVGVIPNQTFTGCGGVNNNDNIRLTTSTDVEIDVWGVTDGSTYTPSGQPGYTYRRLNTSTIPNTTWNAADWTAIDPEDYTNVGSYSYTVSNYQYSIDNGPFLTGTTSGITFSNLAPGNHVLVVKDTSTGCFSAPVNVFIDAVNPTPSVTTFTYVTPVCQNATTNPIPDTSAAGFTTGGIFTSNPSTGIDINATTGEITLANTTAGTYVITYAVVFNTTTCQAASSTDFTIVINPVINPVLGFSYTTPICQNAQATLSPTLAAGFTTGGTFSSTAGLSINGSTGVIDLAASTAGSYTITYISNANAAACLVGGTNTFNIIINPVITPVTGFSYNTPFCSSDSVTLQSPTLVAGFTTGGTFSSTTGLIINGTTGEINIQTSSPGVYIITYAIAANAATCQVAGTNSTQIMIIAPVTIELTGGCQSVNYVLTATPVNGSFVPETATYSWHNAALTEVGTTQSITVTAIGVYTVTITVDGCSTVSPVPFDVTSVFCIIQKGISVNNDGSNDTFDLTGFGVKKLTIFNRLGMKVYSHNEYIEPVPDNEWWGGQSDAGEELPDGTYYYIIDRDNGETRTGWIYINRAQ